MNATISAQADQIKDLERNLGEFVGVNVLAYKKTM